MARSPRLISPVSLSELERRWAATRQVMEAEGIAVLVAENNNNSTGGYVQWLTGIPALDGTPLAVVFPRDDEMTVVNQGLLEGRWMSGERDHPLFSGVKQVLSSPYFPAVNYTGAYEAELLEEALTSYRHDRIGLLGPWQMLYATVKHLADRWPGVDLVDASDLVDPVKVVKSAEEVAMIRSAAAIQDAAIGAAIAMIAPGKTDREIAVAAQNVSHELGSDRGFVLCASSPLGEPAVFGPGYAQGRTICEGDVVSLLVENSGPGGMWSEVGRNIVVGQAPQRLLEDCAFVIEAQQFTMTQFRPGARATDIWNAYGEFLAEHGRPPERRIHCHGQGYDLVERPLIRFDEPMVLGESLNMACHPGFLSELAFVSITDGFLVDANGFERLHQTDQRIFEC